MTIERGTALLERPDTDHDTADTESLRIDEATGSDASAVAELISSSADWYEDLVTPDDLGEHRVDEAWALENFRRREFFVGRLDDEIAGTVSLQEVDEGHLYLGYVYLHTNHVGNGFGRDLLDFAEREMRRRGRSSMVLIAHPEAEWAIKAYRRYGFECIARDKGEILAWQDGWLEPYFEDGFHLYEYRA